MNFNRIFGLFLRHYYLIKSSLPRILDLIYWPTIQIILWGFISKFFTIYSNSCWHIERRALSTISSNRYIGIAKCS